jgi:RNA recognition motif-containing protein
MRIFVRNIPMAASEEEVRQLFAAYGDVGRIVRGIDRKTGRLKDFAHVEMSKGIEAHDAIAALDGAELLGRTLSVQMAQPREDHMLRG